MGDHGDSARLQSEFVLPPCSEDGFPSLFVAILVKTRLFVSRECEAIGGTGPGIVSRECEAIGGTGPGSGRRTLRYRINPAIKGKRKGGDA
jgi:hypothetical protein